MKNSHAVCILHKMLVYFDNVVPLMAPERRASENAFNQSDFASLDYEGYGFFFMLNLLSFRAIYPWNAHQVFVSPGVCVFGSMNIIFTV